MHTVVESPTYLRQARKLGLTDDDLDTIKALMAQRPSLGDVVPGTGGARKVRIRAEGKGKSGGYRVITFYSGATIPVFLLDIYAKSRKAGLSASEVNRFRKITDAISREFKE